jgi:nucleoside-diphosphate-sugar epimerase
MKVAVSGAAGFLGSHLVRGFKARGAEVVPLVRCVDARAPAAALALEDVLGAPAKLAGADVFIHSAAVRHRYGADTRTYRTSNVDLVGRAMRASAAAGVRRFVFVSSVGVYGFPERLPVTEEYPYAPRTMYSETKVQAEECAREIARESAVELCIVRPTIFYGPGDTNGMMDKMATMIRAGTYRVVGSGENELHHAHVDDIVAGTWLAATRPEAAGEHFVLAGPETTTLRRLSELVARAVGRRLPRVTVPLRLARTVASAVDAAAKSGIAFVKREPPINHEKLDVMTLPIRFDVGKARKMLGYGPAIGYEEGVLRTLQGETSGRAA